jgi:hypothetical protein
MHIGKWRLVRLKSAGFGGLNLVDGPDFVLTLNGQNWYASSMLPAL